MNSIATFARVGCSLALLLLARGAAAGAGPVDLTDPEPREIRVAFETSPSDRPDRLDAVYSEPVPAWLEPARPHRAAGLVQLTVRAKIVEERLLAGYRPVPGSFSDFVWVLDAATGRVLSARFQGRIVQDLDWGWFSAEVETQLRVEMGTAAAAGIEPPRTLLGQRLYGICSEPSADCTLVAPARYDAISGYVNAVGSIVAESKGVQVHSFSPLGEAVLAEADFAEFDSALGPAHVAPASDERD